MNKTVKITCELAREEYDLMKAVCDKRGMSIEDYARESISKKIKAFDESKNTR